MPAEQNVPILNFTAWEPIAQYLAPEDIARLQMVCKALNIGFNSPKFDVLWQPFLNELHSIDPKISVTPQPGQTIQGAFIAGITKLKERYKVEVAHLSRRYQDDQLFHSEYPGIFENFNNPNQTLVLKDLKQLNSELEAANIDILKFHFKIARDLMDNDANLSYSALTRFPAKVINDPDIHDYICNQLTSIDLSACALRELPDNIGELQGLVTLQLSDNQLEALPKSITDLTNLLELLVARNKLKELPENINNLKDLIRLDIHGNEIETLPDSIVELPKLLTLDASSNKLGSLPELIGNLENLRTLAVGKNRLKTLPNSIVQLKLIDLDISWNNLTALPETFGELASLNYLYANSNNFTELPESIGKLSDAIMDFRNNQLRTLPKSIFELPKLEYLEFTSNQLTEDSLSSNAVFNQNWIKRTLRLQKPITQDVEPILNQFKRQSDSVEPAAKRQKQRIGQP